MALAASETTPEEKKAGTIEKILSDATAARSEMSRHARELQQAAEGIKDRSYDRALAKAELKEIEELYAAIGVINAADNDLALLTARALDASPEVQRWMGVLKVANASLDRRLKKVQAVAKHVKQVAALFSKLEAVLKGLAKLATLVI